MNMCYVHSMKYKRKCTKWYDAILYIWYIGKYLLSGMNVRKAIREAKFYCIDAGIMSEFLLRKIKKRSYRKVMYGMLEYGSDLHMYMERRDARKAGWEEGHAEGYREGEIQVTINMCKEFAVSKEDTLKRLITQFQLEEEAAKKKLEELW